MPLLPGKENIGENIRILESEGYEYPQARAIALKKAKVPMAKKRKRGGRIPTHILERRLIKLSNIVAARRRSSGGKHRRRARKK